MNRPCLKHLLLISILTGFIPAVCRAHPETGSLPDSTAETEYRIVVEVNPKDFKTRNKLGMILYRKNKLDEAARQFSETLQLSPRDFDAHNGMGLISSKKGRHVEAVSWFTKATALRPEDTLVYFGLGQSSEQLGMMADAEKHYQQALAVNKLNLQKGSHVEQERKNRKTIQNALQKLQVKRAKPGGKD